MISGVFKNDFRGMKLDERCVKMPICYEGRPIGFIDGIQDDFCTVVFFDNEALMVVDQETGTLMSIDLKGGIGEGIPLWD